MGGIGFQQICILAFLAIAIRLHRRITQQPPSPERSTALRLLYVEYAVVGLITVRIIFRLIEYSNGLNSSISRKEAYEYVFDSSMMLIAIALFNVFHPGRLMPGKESDLPSRKVRKAMKKQGQTPGGRMGDYLLPKYENFRSTDSVSQGQYERVPSPSPAHQNSAYEDEARQGLTAGGAQYEAYSGTQYDGLAH